MFLAILLSAFMLFSVFTVGITYFKTQRVQNIRLNGADFDAIMYGLTPEQRELCENNPDIEKTGWIGLCGYILETDAEDTINAGFIYADHTFWNEMMQPAREWVKGKYPREFNEVMATKEALKECGMEGLNVGDTFSATYMDGRGKDRRIYYFRYVGWIWDKVCLLCFQSIF